MPKTENWIGKAFGAKDRAALNLVYRQWADDYDADLVKTGYLHTPVIVGLVSRHVPRRDAAILDAGVGTGSTGAILALLGYNNLHGIDMSEAMLTKAAERKCYAELKQGVLGERLDYVDGGFDAIISTGTFTTGHAPAGAFTELARILEPGGTLMFTTGTQVWEDAGFRSMLDGMVAARVLTAVETTPIYCPMPFSEAESGFTARAHVYRRT
jgi:predicted TPR repeat methyltransferase